MSKPLTTGANLAPLPFEGRLQLVTEAVEARIKQTPTTNPFEMRARLWVRWINANILDVQAGVLS
jgi:hypothetical protein